MNKSIPDIPLPRRYWVNVYLGASLAVGKPISVQNKGAYSILLFESDTAPDTNSRSGRMIEPGQEITVLAGSAGVWAVSRKSDGAIFVQELPQ